MNAVTVSSFVLAGLVALSPLAGAAEKPKQEAPKIKIPEPGVPQVMTMEGRYVRAAYNNEGYVILGYRLVNLSVGEKWMLLEVGMTVRDGVKDFTLKRDALSLETPDGKTIPMASMEEFRKGDTRALEMREKVQRDSINYFPPSASRACRIGFFSQMDSRAMAWDQVDLSYNRACLGRVYFEIPGGITYGQHWLNVKFQDSLIRVPFRVLTKEEDKLLDKHYNSIEKQVEEAFKPPKKS
ncbi:MAG TPA: hypothetical protein VGQ33_13215 [Vicinamibacteria bacterium]|nr:hypothetical protein [Vicinamibacteria bacterium]